VRLAAALTTLVAVSAVAGSRAPEKGCAWKTLSSPELGLEVPVQRCDFGYRVIEFLTLPRKPNLYQSMQDTGKKASLYPVVTVFEKKADETPDAAIKRVALGKLSWYKRKHCLVVPRRLGHLGAGKAAFTLSPDAKYAEKALEAAGGDIPEPPCGELGELADGLTYFEFHPAENPRRFLFVSAGQDTPLFDETALKLLP
jgi:hypothetical protein